MIAKGAGCGDIPRKIQQRYGDFSGTVLAFCMRVGVEGNIGVIFEVNSETDFVAKNEQFLELLETVKNALIANKPADLDAALACTVNGETIADLVTTATATIGEKISLRRMAVVEKADDEVFASYMHMGGKISALAELKGADEKVA